ncbi:MAG: hypothetical protein DI589_06595 [Shinella sp.]|nr:MAG: hypothetical protein DI589_06595 [Shinella sp.]
MSFVKSQLTNRARPVRISNTVYIRDLFYATNDTKAEVTAAGYFNNAKADLSVGSLITALVDADGTPARVEMRVTAVPDSGNVTVADISGVAAG